MLIIKVRKPKYPESFWTRWGAGYEHRWWKWYNSLPKDGDKIKITWFPSSKWPEKSAYTGEGTFRIDKSMNQFTEESFYFVYPTGATLTYIGGNFDYIKL